MSAHRYAALGFDPAPGDCWAMSRLSRDADRVADELLAATVKVEALGAASWCWRGDAAVEFATALGELPRSLSAGRRAFRVTAMALMAYRDALLDLQAEGRRAEADAEDALHRLHAATGGLYRSLGDYRYTRPLTPEGSMVLLGGDAADLAQQDLDAARAWGLRIEQRAATEARVAADAVRRATEFAPAVPGIVQRLQSGLADKVRNNPELLTRVSEIAGVVGMLALFIPVGGVLLGLVAAGVAVAATGLLAAYADGSTTDVALAAAGFATGGLAAGAARMAKSARGAELGEGVVKLPSLLDDVAGTTAERPWRVAKVQLDLAGLALGVHGYAGAMARRRGDAPPRPSPLKLPAVAVGTAQPGRRTTPRCIDATPPGPEPRLATAGTAPASGW